MIAWKPREDIPATRQNDYEALKEELGDGPFLVSGTYHDGQGAAFFVLADEEKDVPAEFFDGDMDTSAERALAGLFRERETTIDIVCDAQRAHLTPAATVVLPKKETPQRHTPDVRKPLHQSLRQPWERSRRHTH